MTTTTEGLVFTEPVTYIATACPEWCTERPLHPCTDDWGDGRVSRWHEGPTFGEFLSTRGSEYTSAPGTVNVLASLYCTDAELSVEQLRQLAADATAAAQWLEAHR